MSVVDWKSEGSGPTWVPVLYLAEAEVGLPQDLLASIAYQESHFREDIIRGTTASRAGALGMMQLMPRFFPSVRAPVPFTDNDVSNQIEDAAHQMAALFQSTQDWDLAIAAYNAGLGNVHKYSGIPPFDETQAYVDQVTRRVVGLV